MLVLGYVLANFRSKCLECTKFTPGCQNQIFAAGKQYALLINISQGIFGTKKLKFMNFMKMLILKIGKKQDVPILQALPCYPVHWHYEIFNVTAVAYQLYIFIIIQFICILESQVLECSMGSFYTQRLQKLICLHLPTDCFVEISPHSTGHIAWVLIPFCSLICILC